VSAEDETPVAALPQGSECVCFDATVLIHYQDNDHLDTLRDLFPGPTITPNVVTGMELVKNAKARELNTRILAAEWLQSVPVTDPGDITEVRTLVAVWGGKPNKNEGEAEVIVLCERHGWIAIMDDYQGRSTAADRGRMRFAYMSTMLLAAAAAIGITGLDADRAWEIHRAVESKRKRPRLQNEALFKRLVQIFRAAWEQNGRPPWPTFLTDPRLDQLVDRADPLD